MALGNGDGSFQPSKIVRSYGILNGAGLSAGGPVVGDFNGDGKLDIAMDESQSQASNGSPSGLTVYPGHGDGTFGNPIRSKADLHSSPVVASGGLPLTLFAADVNHDGNLDLILGQGVAYGNGDGTFVLGPRLPGDIQAVADFNSDGSPDLLLLTDPAQLGIALGTPQGTFAAPLPLAIASGVTSLVVGDFNNDGHPDVAVAGAGFFFTSSQVFLGRGDGTFSPAPFSYFPTNLRGAADFNHDGNLDLVSDSNIWLGHGDGTFAPFTAITATPAFGLADAVTGDQETPGNPLVDALAIADVNGDGQPDLAVAYRYNSAAFPDQGRTAHVSLLLNRPVSSGPTSTAVSAATYQGLVAPNSLVTVFGTNLAAAVAVADTRPLPTQLGGVRLHIRYRAGYPDDSDQVGPLLYVSPTQISFLLPALAPAGTATATPFAPAFVYFAVERVGEPFVPDASIIPLVGAAPGLFTYPGTDWPAATAVRINPDGTQTPVPLISSSLRPTNDEAAIDLSQGPVYLSLYGTGFDNLTAPSSVVCTLNSFTSVPTTYVGPQGQTPGLDQINLLLPANLPSGATTLSCVQPSNSNGVDFPITNQVTILIK